MNVHADFNDLPIAAISDALDMLGCAGQCQDIKPLNPGMRIAGQCFTVAYVPVDESAADRTVGDFIDDVPPGSIVAIANQGRRDCTVWGDILTLTAKTRGLAGTVIDGVCRDYPAAVGLGYPIFSLGTHMRTGKGRVRLRALQERIVFGGVTVSPGDLAVGSADGLVFVPALRQEEVLSLALRIESLEQDICRAVRRGMPLREAREKHGYHRLGTRAHPDAV